MWRLVVERGPNKGKAYHLKGQGTLSIGRSRRNGITLRDQLVSRLHGRISAHGDRLILQDCGSHNGTQVNHENIQEASLRPGDLITVGETEISVFQAQEKDTLLQQEIQGYQFLERIGRGGGGTVYLALQVSLNRQVAIKVLSAQRLKDHALMQNFLEEARVAATLNHPHLVGIHDIITQEDMCFFSMEYMPGGSLGEKALVEKKLPVKEVVNYLVQASEGLDYLHGKGFVHRDIKPANLMINNGGQICIGDFGIANKSQDPSGRVSGSPHFMSPEQIQGFEVNARSDLYSLGCTAFRLLSGMPPFIGSNLQEILRAHIHEKPPKFQSIKGMKKRMAKVFDTLLEKEPDKRFACAREFSEALAQAQKPIGPLRRRWLR